MRTLNTVIVLVSSAMGSLLEWYDFAIYGFLAPVMAPLFFPSHHYGISLVVMYGLFAAGYLARPLGGVIFGCRSDMKGRQSTLVFTIVLMTAPTMLIGLLPTYAAIGALSPCLLVLLRIGQGLAAGGELMSVATFAFDVAPTHRRSFVTSMVYCGAALGVFLASFVMHCLYQWFSTADITRVAWRYPFLLAIVSGVVAAYLRYSQMNSFNLINIDRNEGRSPPQIWRQYRGQCLKMMALFAPTAILFYLGLIFIPAQLVHEHRWSPTTLQFINQLAMAVMVLAMLLIGYWVDRCNSYRWLLVSALCQCVLAIPVMWCFSQHALWLIALSEMTISLLIASMTAPLLAFILQRLPAMCRCTMASFSYNVVYAVIGGTAPMIGAVALLHHHAYFLLGCYLSVMSLLAACVLLFGYSDHHENLEHKTIATLL